MPPSSRRGRRRPLGAAVLAILGILVINLLSSSHGGHSGPHGSARAPGSRPSVGPPGTPATPAKPPPAKPAPGYARFGVSVNRLFNDRTFTPAQMDSALAALRSTGATTARSDALWELSEPQPPQQGQHHYSWAFDDQIVSMLAAHSLRWLPIIDYTALWDIREPGESERSAPRDLPYFAAFAWALAARYGSQGTFWAEHPGLPRLPVDTYEIWNEPDSAFFFAPAPDLGLLGELYEHARSAILAADPAARVILGGLTGPAHTLPAMLSVHPELAGHLDGVGIHPYAPTPRAVIGRVRAARQALRRLGLGSVPLYVTEFGWVISPPASSHYVPAPARGPFLRRTLAALGHSDCGVAATIVYTLVTPERIRSSDEDWFGVLPPRPGLPGNDLGSVRQGFTDAAAPGPVRPLCR